MDQDMKLNPDKYRGKEWDFYEDRYIDVNGIRTRYWSEGDGEPVILIHGYGGSVEEWCWTIPALKKGFRAIAVDIPGFGLTDRPDAPYTYEFFASFVSGFMDSLGIAGARVLGHSMGGAITLNLALRHPGRVKSMVLDAPAYGWKFPFAMHLVTVPVLGELLFRPPSSPEEVGKGFRGLTYEYFGFSTEILKRYYGFPRLPGYQRASLKYMRNYLTLTGFTRQCRELGKFYDREIPKVKAPVLIIWGKQDLVVAFESSASLLASLPHAEFWPLDPCGHSPHFEYRDEFNARVLGFFTKN